MRTRKGLAGAAAGLLAALLGRAPGEPASAEIYVSTDDRIVVHADTADGDVAPLRMISGPATGLDGVTAVAVDLENRELYALSLDPAAALLVFDLNASGNVAPKRRIAGGLTTLGPGLTGLAVDPVNDEIFVTKRGDIPAVAVFERLAAGNVAPKRRIEPGGASGISNPSACFVDLVADELHLVQPDSVRVFERLANGSDVAPRRVLSGFSSSRPPASAFVDLDEDELFVSIDSIDEAFQVYARDAAGNDSPLRAVEGDIDGETVDLVVSLDGEVVTANAGLLEVQVYDVDADGSVSPLRVIAGASTGLGFPLNGVTSTRALGGAAGFVAPVAAPEPRAKLLWGVALATLAALGRISRSGRVPA